MRRDFSQLWTDCVKRVADNVEKGYNIIVLSDKDISKYRAPIPSLLALSAVHQCLIKKNLRSKVDLIVESGKPEM